jgi:hypothetical protein
MYTNDKRSILMLDLNYNSRSKALEGADPISTKTNQPCNKILFFQTALCHQRIHNQQCQTISSRSRKHLLDTQQQGYLTPILHNITQHTCPTCIIHGCNLITSKRYKLGILNNNFNCFSHLMVYVFCHFPASPIRPNFFGDRSKF